MAIVSDVEIRLRADIARLQQDMTAARQTVNSAMDGITRAAGLAKGAIGALAGILTVGAFAGWIKGAIDATDAVADISARTGIAIKDIAALQLAFQKGGMEAGDMEGSMVKLSKAIAEGDDAFRRIGVATKTTNGTLRDSKDVLYDVADRFNNLEDGTAKTALAVEIFGKAGAAMIPLLNDGSKGLREMAEMADTLGITFDERAVKAAGDFNDTLDFLKLAGQGVARQVAGQLLPTLNAIAGSFLELITKGDGVRKAAEGIGAGFKVLYTVGVIVGQTFNAVASTIGMLGAQIVALLQGDFKTAMNVGFAWQDDMKSSFKASAKAITDAWSGVGSTALEALVQTTKTSGTIAAKVDKDAKAQEDAYRNLVNAIKMKIAETDAEANTTQKLTDSQKLAIAFDQMLADGKVKATKAQQDYYKSLLAALGANEATIKANERQKANAEQAQKAIDELNETRRREIEDARREAEGNEELVRTFGMSKQAIEEEAVARLQARLDRRADLELDEKEVAHLTEMIELRRRNAAAIGKGEDQRQQKEFWESVDKTAHDTFVSILDGGKDLGTRLKDTLKNTFFDWLYQMTLKKWIINIGMDAGATGGTAGGIGSLLSNLSNLMGSGSGSLSSILANGIQTGFDKLGLSMGTGAPGSLATALGNAGGIYAGYGMGNAANSAISGKYSVGASGIQKAITAAAAAYFPLFGGPIAGAVLGVVNRAFGRGPKETTGQGITGTFGADSFSGQSYTDWIKKGGWFRSDKRGTDMAALGGEQAAALNTAYKAIKDSTSAFASALGVPANVVTDYTKQIKLALTGDAAKDQKLLADLFTQMGDELAGRVLPNIAQFVKEGETAAATLQRLAAEFQTVDAVLTALNLTSQQVFGAVGTASVAARDRLVELAGGLEAFAAQSDFFVQNFLTDAEKLAPVQKQVSEQLSALGYSGLRTVDDFKAAVMGLAQSGALATEAGAKTYAGLLALAPAFKQVADAMAAAEETAKQATAAQAETLKATVGVMFDALQRSVDARKKDVQAAFNSVMAGIEDRIGATSDKVGRLQGLSSLLAGTRAGAFGMDRAAAQAQIQAALAIGRASGVLPDADSLRDAVAAVSQDAQDQFSSFVDYQRDALRTQNSIEELAGLTDTELSVAKQTLDVLNAQKAAAQQAYDKEVARLDEMLAKTQTQIDAINGVRTDVQALPAAFAQVANAIQAALGNRAVASQPTVTNRTQVEALYNSLLGRASDEPGITYQLQKMAEGYTLEQIRQGILNSAEYQGLQNSTVYTGQQAGRMAPSVAAEQQTINDRMESAMTRTAAAVEQLAQEFNRVSAGGNALLTETA